MRTLALVSLTAVAGFAAAARADTDAKIDFHTSIRAASGARIEISGSFRADLDANGVVLNEATVEIEINPPPDPDRGTPRPPDRLRVAGFARTNTIDPCWMPALVLLALDAVTPEDVERTLGFRGTVTRSRGFVAPPEPESILRVLGVLIAQANTLNPRGAARASQLAAAAFGLQAPPEPDSVCLPEPVRR